MQGLAEYNLMKIQRSCSQGNANTENNGVCYQCGIQNFCVCLRICPASSLGLRRESHAQSRLRETKGFNESLFLCNSLHAGSSFRYLCILFLYVFYVYHRIRQFRSPVCCGVQSSHSVCVKTGSNGGNDLEKWY